MEAHHAESIRNLVREFESKPEVSALILGGSLAHGFARPDSDVDVTFVVSSEELARRRQGGRLHYNNRELCTYPGGYVDGKYVDLEFLRLVAKRGSDPARYAFQGNRILFSRIDGLEQLLADIVRFPVEQKADRLQRFGAQLLAWRWYHSEGIKKDNRYLILLAQQKVTLFSCRLVLTVNEMLYPYHKWMLRVVQTAPKQPPDFAARLEGILAGPSVDFMNAHCDALLEFVGLDPKAANEAWPTRFMHDTELRWLHDEPAIDDL